MKFVFQRDMGMCRLCGATRKQRTFGREKYVGAGQSLRRCGYCGGVYLGPDPSPKSIEQFYRHEYRKLYLGEVPFLSESLFFRHRLDREYAQERRSYIAETLPLGARVLELGSGYGSFLSELSLARPDLELFSCEPDRENRTKRIGTAQVTFIELADLASHGPFDALVAFHVFEHLVAPAETLAQLVAALRPGSGRIVIEVPDVLAQWRSWKNVHPAHLSYFSASSLTRLMLRGGVAMDYAGLHPHGPMFAGTLLAVGVAPAAPGAPHPPEPATPQEIQLLDRHIAQYRWTAKQALLDRVKKALVRLGFGGMIGFLQRWSFYRAMKRESYAVSKLL